MFYILDSIWRPTMENKNQAIIFRMFCNGKKKQMWTASRSTEAQTLCVQAAVFSSSQINKRPVTARHKTTVAQKDPATTGQLEQTKICAGCRSLPPLTVSFRQALFNPC